MPFGFKIERKKYILFVGIGKPQIIAQTAYYIFDGWTDLQQKKKFFGSLSHWSDEVSAQRTTPAFDGMLIIISLANRNAREVPGEGTPTGVLFQAIYDNRTSNPEKIEQFFTQSGIAFHRADTFIKPVKTIWQILQERF